MTAMTLEQIQVFASEGNGHGQRVLTCRGALTMATLAGVNERLRISLDATGISQVLSLYSTRADAEQALS